MKLIHKVIPMLLVMFFSISLEVSASYKSSLYKVLYTSKDIEQVIVVRNTGPAENFKAIVSLYEKERSHWIGKVSYQGVIGKGGFTPSKKEGDTKTPIGKYSIGMAFGYAEKPSTMTWTYTKVGKNDYWIDDPVSSDYNQWMYESGDPHKKWKSFERMNHPLYKYALVINHNRNPVIPNGGSAIFLHVWRDENSSTIGCVALEEKNVVDLLKRLDPNRRVVIVMGSETDIISALK
ncbi:L,D-transpeptidase family protein [Mangrovibacillus cuniculi]|uniref:L,D-transpeptidase family protein n=1 Tax=Mangrovibacillus cuniculi TaxID=2593652 RepID=A0A7S8HG34_9BACI|nr:L,D-transpeptidase family protein [Mangrovibacillus cuniculi]QPC47569.1 L,D-transpeptidase family protein [Mangrovibacillus cuniculi]